MLSALEKSDFWNSFLLSGDLDLLADTGGFQPPGSCPFAPDATDAAAALEPQEGPDDGGTGWQVPKCYLYPCIFALSYMERRHV